MLDHAVSPTIPQLVWGTLGSTAQLPCKPEEFLSGAVGMVSDPRRSHHRLSCRGRAVIHYAGGTLGVYTLDVSPKGFGLYSPVQLMPQQQVELHLDVARDQWPPVKLQILRCRRVQQDCYLCGTGFLPEPLSPAEYRTLMRHLRGSTPSVVR